MLENKIFKKKKTNQLSTQTEQGDGRMIKGTISAATKAKINKQSQTNYLIALQKTLLQLDQANKLAQITFKKQEEKRKNKIQPVFKNKLIDQTGSPQQLKNNKDNRLSQKSVQNVLKVSFPLGKPFVQQKQQKVEIQKGKKQKDGKKKNNYRNYKYNAVQITSKDLDDKVKKLKKIISQKFKKIKQIKVYYSKTYPMLVFSSISQNQGSQQYQDFKQIFKTLKSSKYNRNLFQQLFDRFFLSVPNKYYDIVVFALSKAKQIPIRIEKSQIFDLDQGNKVMLYYTKNLQKESINLIVFNKDFTFIEFDSSYIQQNAKHFPKQYELYKQFHDEVFEEKAGQTLDIFNNQEVESDQDKKATFQQKSLNELEIQLNKIIQKDLKKYEEQIQKIQNQYQTLLQKRDYDYYSSKIDSIYEQIETLQQAKQNFQTEVKKTKEKIEKNTKCFQQITFVARSLKKLIIAQKQLDSKLPIIGKKRKILQMLQKQNLLIIQGETGSGKSTQLPQILCQYYNLFDDPEAKPVLVSQPRRLATRSLAERVASEMCEKVGGFVDYVASAGRKVNPNAKIIFKLDRLVLDELCQDQILSKYSCLVIDQAHERTISIDVILGLIKGLLAKRNDFKVIVTSASMDITLFQYYFQTKTIKVSGRMHPVQIIYKQYQNFNEGNPNHVALKIQKLIIEELLNSEGTRLKNQYKGHILCFCSNIEEINWLVNAFKNRLNPNVFSVFALHGKLSSSQQKTIFQNTGRDKFIFANRIAQTAITIDGVKVVIDPGLDYEVVYDQKRKYSSMKLNYITQSSAKQRAGRSGRTGPGYCFRLYSVYQFNKRYPNKLPQIINSSLQNVVLRLKSLNIKDVISFPYISRPDEESLKNSLKVLTLIGALSFENNSITRIGSLLIKIPIEPFLSRAIIQSLIFEKVLSNDKFISSNWNKFEKLNLPYLKKGLTSTVIAILALIINFSNLFWIKKEDQEKGQFVKYKEFSDEQGDFFFLQNIYKKFLQLKEKNQIKKNNSGYKNRQLNQWIDKNYLNYNALKQTQQIIREITAIIDDFQINQIEFQNEIDNIKCKLRGCENQREVVLSTLISSFSSNVCKYSDNPYIGYTLISQRIPLRIYGTSNLQLLGITPKWIVCYDLYQNQEKRLYCKVAHAITYDFMKKHIDKNIWKLMDFQNIEKKDPFYKPLSYKLPSKVIQQLRFEIRKSQLNGGVETIFDKSFPMINEQQNQIIFYFLQNKDQPQQSYWVEIQIQNYINKILTQSKQAYKHNFIGNIHIIFKHGYQINSIEFTNKEFCFQIQGPQEWLRQIQEDSVTYGKSQMHTIQIKSTDRKKKIGEMKSTKQKLKVFINDEQNKKSFANYLNFYKQQITVKQNLSDKRRKIPQTKIILYFFAGKVTDFKQTLYIHFQQTDSTQQGLAYKMLDLIKQGVRQRKKKQRGYICKFDIQNMKLSKSGRGINLLYTDLDQIQMAEELYDLDTEGYLTVLFKFPRYIKKFRQPQISQASKTNKQWKQQILQLLQKQDIKSQNLTINIRGSYKPQNKITQAFQKTLRVDMTAEILTLDNIYNKLKQAYDGKKKKIGCQKVHVRAFYDQRISFPEYKVFDALYQQYQALKQTFKFEFPLMNLETIPLKIKGKSKIMIVARSRNRQDFIKPQRIISNLFTHRLIKLQQSQYNFLCYSDLGQSILEGIQQIYRYKIYFGFDRLIRCLKVYSHQHQFKGIEEEIRNRLKILHFYQQQISYRGKNLRKVNEVLQELKKMNENLSYQIIFRARKVKITASFNDFQFIKNQINKIVNSGKSQCNICSDLMKNPYRFLNCQCSFCWSCISQHLRSFRDSGYGELLACPNDDCKQPINVHDVKTLLSQEQFNKISDIVVKKYVQKHRQKYINCNHCQNIFDAKQIEEQMEIDCEICGKVQCLRCKISHRNYTCQEWKNRNKDLSDVQLKKLGIKRCPNCKNGIQKNKGCNHMTCSQCQTHFCWHCLQQFTTGKQCSDHLVKEHGGIFDANYRE